MPFRVVLTGGIASGKTSVASEFASLGIPVIDTDQLNRDVIAPGTPALAKIAGAFGRDVLDASGALNRARMREIVFADPKKRLELESITHPAIRDELSKASLAAVGPYQIHAIPLFVEKGAKGNYDRVLVVDCPEGLQLARLVQRDGSTADLARKILAAQATREQRLAVATDVIVNDGSRKALGTKVAALHTLYLSLAAEKLADGGV